jgi:hypothetical protein
MKFQILQTVVNTLIVVGMVIAMPFTAQADDLRTGHNYVNINGWTWWVQLPVGADVCEAVRKDFGDCHYLAYSPEGKQENTHYVVTQRVDSLIIKNPSGRWIDYLEIDSGLDHVEIVAKQQNVSKDQVRWDSGKAIFKGTIVYEAELTVTK